MKRCEKCKKIIPDFIDKIFSIFHIKDDSLCECENLEPEKEVLK